jgi:hypothetical protein
MSKSRNTVLEALLREYGFSHEALAEEVNRVCGEITGKPGNASDRDIRRWVSGAVGWPTTRYLLALTQIFDRQPEAMGFVPRGTSSRVPDLPPRAPGPLTAIVRDRVGDSDQAEAASHRALASIPHQFHRNRALATARLALAQLHQRDVEQACTTASTAVDLVKGQPVPGRMRSLLGDFYRDLITTALTTSVAQEWGDRFRSEWSRA